MSKNKQDGKTVNVAWHDFHRVLISLGYRQIPNHSTGKLTYFNEKKNQRFLLMKEDAYNLDYFAALLKQLSLEAEMFFFIAFKGKRPKRRLYKV